MIAELLDLCSAARPELLHNGLLLGCAGIKQLQDLSAQLDGQMDRYFIHPQGDVTLTVHE